MKTVLKRVFLSFAVVTASASLVTSALVLNEINKLKTAVQPLFEFSKTDLPGGVELPGL